MTLNIERR